MAMFSKLTTKQNKFIEIYDGNGTRAARLAGYKGNDNVLGVTANELLRNPKIAQAIKARETKVIKPLIANREQRQEFWTEVMKDQELDMGLRLKASELLGKSEADFLLKHEHSGPDGKPIEVRDVTKLTDEELDLELAKMLLKNEGAEK